MAQGSITRRRNQDGTLSYVYHWDEPRAVGPDGRKERRRQRERAFRRRRDAEDFRALTQHQLRDASYIQPSREQLGAYLGRWVEGLVGVKPTTVNTYRYRVRAHWVPRLGTVALADLSTAAIDGAVAQLVTGGYTGSTVAESLVMLRRALADAVRHGLLATNPAEDAAKPLVERAPLNPWTREEAAAFLRATAGPAGLVYRFALETMLRVGEIVALRWTDVDLTKGELVVRRTETVDRDGKPAEGTPKSGKPRTVPLDGALVAALSDHRAAQTAGAVQVFDQGGKAMRRGDLWRRFSEAVEAAGVRAIRFHDLRHTGGSLLAADGINPKALQQIMGHSDVATTLRLYVWPEAEERRAAVSRLAALLSGAC